jgi:hypothetical protein
MNNNYEADRLQIYMQPIDFAKFFLKGNLSGNFERPNHLRFNPFQRYPFGQTDRILGQEKRLWDTHLGDFFSFVSGR